MGVSGRIARFFQASQLTPLAALAAMLLGLFAVAITPREEFFMRGAARPRPGIQLVPNNPPPGGAPRPSATPPNGVTFSGTSSLSLGQWIPGCVPILIEMGQRDQAEARRSELHQMLVRTALAQSGML